MNRNSGVAAVVLCVVLLLAGQAVLAAEKIVPSDYPNRPIRLITPAPPGGSTDFLSRIIAPRLADTLKGSIVIDNRGGAGGVVAA